MNIAVITGASSGIGMFLAEGFAKHGYKVIALDILERNFDNDHIYFYKVDLRYESQIKEAFQDILHKFGKVHVLINNGAVSRFHKSILDITSKEFDDVINTNLRGAFLCCKEFVKANENASFGRIINIASTRFNQNEANWEAYGASKGGIISLTNSLCVSLYNTPITVNAISPGWIQVDDYNLLESCDHKQHPSGRVGKPSDIVNACLFLANEENDFINGANLVIDGGMTKRMIYE